MDIEKLFDKCINCYSHEGEFEIAGNTVTIFRRCGYEDFENLDEDEMPKWVDGDEAVGAFVNKEEFFGWWPQDEDDLYECMKEVLEYLLHTKGVKFTLTAKVRRMSDEDEKKAVRKVKLLNEVKKEFDVEIEQIKNVKVEYNDYEDTITCKIINYNDFWKLVEIAKGECDEASISESDPNKDALENMFKYKYDLL